MFSGCVCLVTQFCLTLWGPWTVARQALPSMEFSRQDYWSRFAISYSRGSSWPRHRTRVSCVSCTGSPWGCKELDTTEWPTFSHIQSCLLNERMRACCMLSRFSWVWLFATLWTAVHQSPLSMWFSRQEYWSGWPGPPPGGLPNDISFGSSTAGGFVTAEPPGKPKWMNAWLHYKCQQLHLLVSHLDGKLWTTTADHPHWILTT